MNIEINNSSAIDMEAFALIKNDDAENLNHLMNKIDFDNKRQDRCLKYAMGGYFFECAKILLKKVEKSRIGMEWFQVGIEKVLMRAIKLGDLDLVKCFYPYSSCEQDQKEFLNSALSSQENAIAKIFLKPNLFLDTQDSAFRTAIYNGNIEMMDLLINMETINDISFETGFTCLEYAVNAGQVNAVLKLMEVCDVKAYSSRAFIHSIYHQNVKIIDLLYCEASFKHLLTHLDDEREKIMDMEEALSVQFFKNLDHVGTLVSKNNKRAQFLEIFGEEHLPQTAALKLENTLKKVLPKTSKKSTKVRL